MARAPASYPVQGSLSHPTPRRLELLAASRSWAELEPCLHDAAVRTLIAQERMCRGEDLRGEGLRSSGSDLPWVLEPWEPKPYHDPRDDGPTG